MNHDFWLTLLMGFVNALGAAFAAYHGSKNGSN